MITRKAYSYRELTPEQKISAAANQVSMQILGRPLKDCDPETRDALRLDAIAILRAAEAIPETV